MTKLNFKKSIILGGSKGIGKSIFKFINRICDITICCGKKEIDLSDILSVKEFVKKNKKADILVLNSGGPPAKLFDKISEEEWMKYFYQLFYSYVYILKNIKISNGGYIFYISSTVVKEPNDELLLSSTYRSAMTNLLKGLSKNYAKKGIGVINISVGPFKTQRVKDLIGSKSKIKEYEKKLPTGKLGNPDEIGKFIKFILSNKIKYINGSVINFDGCILSSF